MENTRLNAAYKHFDLAETEALLSAYIKYSQCTWPGSQRAFPDLHQVRIQSL